MIEEPKGFATFWAIWKDHQRKSDGRGKARPAYKQMIDMGHEPQDIIDGARWYLRNLKTEEDRKFIPLAASWLRSERFMDECEKERSFQAERTERAEKPRNVVQIKTGQTQFLRDFAKQQKAGNDG